MSSLRWISVLFLAASTAWPQIQQAVGGRTLLATVLDTSGKTQVDFGSDDFVVTEDGDDREVLDVHIADYPVVLLIDDGADAASIPSIRSAAARFISRIGERPVAIGTLSHATELMASFEDDRTEVLDRLAALTPVGSSGTSTLPAVAGAAKLLHDTGAPFSAIVVVTARAIDANQLVQGELLPSILESGATVHVVAGRPASPDGVAAPDVPDLLRVLSDQTHGQYAAIFSTASYGIALDRLADRLSAEIMIEFLVPAGASTGEVRVGVRRPGARVVGLGVSK